MPEPISTDLPAEMGNFLKIKKDARSGDAVSAKPAFYNAAKQYMAMELALVGDAIPSVKYLKITEAQKTQIQGALTTFQTSLDEQFQKLSSAGSSGAVQSLLVANQPGRNGLKAMLDRVGDAARAGGSEPLKLLYRAYATTNLVGLSAPFDGQADQGGPGGGPNKVPPPPASLGATLITPIREHKDLAVKLITNAKVDEAKRPDMVGEFRRKEIFIYGEILDQGTKEQFQKIDEYRLKMNPGTNPNTQNDIATARRNIQGADGKTPEEIVAISQNSRRLFVDLADVPTSLVTNEVAQSLKLFYSNLKVEEVAAQRSKPVVVIPPTPEQIGARDDLRSQKAEDFKSNTAIGQGANLAKQLYQLMGEQNVGIRVGFNEKEEVSSIRLQNEAGQPGATGFPPLKPYVGVEKGNTPQSIRDYMEASKDYNDKFKKELENLLKPTLDAKLDEAVTKAHRVMKIGLNPIGSAYEKIYKDEAKKDIINTLYGLMNRVPGEPVDPQRVMQVMELWQARQENVFAQFSSTLVNPNQPIGRPGTGNQSGPKHIPQGWSRNIMGGYSSPYGFGFRGF